MDCDIREAIAGFVDGDYYAVLTELLQPEILSARDRHLGTPDYVCLDCGRNAKVVVPVNEVGFILRCVCRRVADSEVEVFCLHL